MATFRTVVTGASSGIGRETALALAEDGHALVLTARRDAELRAVAERCLAAGAPAVRVVAGDITVAGIAPGLADAVQGLGEGEIVLVNNAGCASFGEFHEQPIEAAVQMVRVILEGAMRATHALLPLMLAEGKGTVVNVLSIAARQEFTRSQAYSSAKAGLSSFSRTLALDYRRRGIRVTGLIVGATDTPLWDPVADPPDRRDMLKPRAVAETVRHVIDLPRDRVVDEIVLTPPNGTL